MSWNVIVVPMSDIACPVSDHHMMAPTCLGLPPSSITPLLLPPLSPCPSPPALPSIVCLLTSQIKTRAEYLLEEQEDEVWLVFRFVFLSCSKSCDPIAQCNPMNMPPSLLLRVGQGVCWVRALLSSFF